MRSDLNRQGWRGQASGSGQFCGWAKLALALDEAITDRDEEIKRLRDALEFYANPDTYGSDDKSRTTGNECFDIVCFDFTRDFKPRLDYAGARARAALSGETDEAKS